MQRKAALALLACVVLLVLATAACSQSNTARAELKDTGGRVVGEATLISASDRGGVEITLRVHDLPPGTNGVHIHDISKCDSPDFVSAGGHYNPSGNQHGLENPDGPHAGDLPNLTVSLDGTGTLAVVNTLLQNSPEGENLFDGDGIALVIHSGPDDQTSEPSGNSGTRIACGAIIHD